MENFNLKKFLVENKLTTNSKMLKEEESFDNVQSIGVEIGYDFEIGVEKNPAKPNAPIKEGVACIPAEQNDGVGYIYLQKPEQTVNIGNILANYDDEDSQDFDTIVEILGEIIFDYYPEEDPNMNIEYFVGHREGDEE